MFRLKIGVVEAVQQKVHQIWHDRLGPLSLQKFHNVVVGQRGKLDQDLPHDPDSGFSRVDPWKVVKIPDDPLNIPMKLHHGWGALGQGCNALLFPCPVKPACGSFLLLVGSGGVQYPHKDIAVHHCLHTFDEQGDRDLESGVCLHAVGVDGDHRNLGHTRFFQSPADKADIVGSPASSAGLAHEYGCAVQVIRSGQKSLHHLADDDKGWIAGVVIYILEPHVYGGAVIIFQYLKVVAKSPDSRFQQVKVDGGHLGTQDGVILFHVLSKQYPVVGAGNHLSVKMVFVPDLQRGDKGADPDAGRAQIVYLVNL